MQIKLWTITKIQFCFQFQLDDYEESNSISEAPSTGLVRVRSRLVVDNVLPAERSAYTCVARSGAETAIATSVVYSAPGK